jgi:hypothetical protein
MRDHKTKKISLKKVEIDKKIIPVIKWLNSFDDICTTHCCEGDDKLEIEPYVLFWCLMPDLVLEIAKKLGHLGTCSIWVTPGSSPYRWSLKFHSKKCMKTFIKHFLKEHK